MGRYLFFMIYANEFNLGVTNLKQMYFWTHRHYKDIYVHYCYTKRIKYLLPKCALKLQPYFFTAVV